MKLYVDTTGELVLDNSTNPLSQLDDGWEYRYPAFSEIQRINVDSNYLRLEGVSTDRVILSTTIYSDIEDSGGTPYVSFAALKTALDSYFDDTV